MTKKQIYIKPRISVMLVQSEGALLGNSGVYSNTENQGISDPYGTNQPGDEIPTDD